MAPTPEMIKAAASHRQRDGFAATAAAANVIKPVPTPNSSHDHQSVAPPKAGPEWGRAAGQSPRPRQRAARLAARP